MFTREFDRQYRMIVEGSLALLTSPFLFDSAVRAMPQLVYPILPLYYLADAIAYTVYKPTSEENGDNTMFTFTNRMSRNAGQFLWNVVPGFFYHGLVAAGGMPLATIAFALVVLGKCRTESRYESSEYKADALQTDNTNYVWVTPNM